MELLKGIKAVITGGSEGIGFAIAMAFVKNGADVIIISRNKDKLQNAKEKLSVSGQNIYPICYDLSNLSEIPNLVKEIHLIFEEVDVLVNNAAMTLFDKVENIKPQDLAKIIELNVQSPYVLTQQLLPSLVNTKGNIINISSYFSHRMIPGRYSTAYSLTKGAIDAFTKSLACELGPKGVRVNAIAPGSVKTPLFNAAMRKMKKEERIKFEESVKTIYPIGHVGEPDDLGGIAVFLASNQAKWVTGSIMSIDGGLTTN
ncbi:SDR family oxidoreductase [Kordia sp. YSTF-M3]|uniref:SDR family oxidoreductase n=1 Tax=Kordia aestuariivivens TaxID=2759037 RepID=A0ABR7QBJ6_9FLAO|nr:SDR family oxidoreductase [Kordia aestuariivivens]MBC8755954.1 SDR family oxidoreductase [Kordia aestuariivivens]